MEGQDKQIVLHEGHKGQGGEQLGKPCRLEGIDHNGQHVHGQNTRRGGQRMV